MVWQAAVFGAMIVCSIGALMLVRASLTLMTLVLGACGPNPVDGGSGLDASQPLDSGTPADAGLRPSASQHRRSAPVVTTETLRIAPRHRW